MLLCRTLLISASLMGLAVTLASPASAQEGAPAGPTEQASTSSGDIVVTARRREENLQDVPVAVTAVSGSTLQERGITDATQLNQLVPALRVEAFNSPTSMNIGIRGVRPSEIAPGQDPSVGVVVADISYGFTIGISPLLFDLQSVQVLKGPQGTLFGRNTTGGVMIITPQRPTDRLEGMVSAGATFFRGGEGVKATGVLNVPLSDAFAIRAAVDYQNHDGYVRNVTNPATVAFYQTVPNTGVGHLRRLNDQDQLSWRVGALLTPTAGVKSYFLYQGTRLRGDGTALVPTAVRPGSPATFVFSGAGGRPSITDEFGRIQQLQKENFWSAQANERTFVRLNQWSVSNTTEIEIADGVSIKNNIGYRDFDRNEQQDLDGFPFQVLEASIPDTGHEFVEELQLQGSHSQFDWVAGLFYTKQVIERDNNRVVLNGADVGLSENHAVADSYAAYAQATWRIPGVYGLSATGGIRYTHDKREFSHSGFRGLVNTAPCALKSGGVTLPQNACVLTGSKSFNTPTWLASLAYQADPHTLVYASYSRGYRAGGFNYTATATEDFGPFDPEYVDAFEIGLKKEWFLGGDAMIRSNIALFHSDYRDIQRFVQPPDGVLPSILNASSASIDGGELELTIQPSRAVQFGLNYAYTKPDYKEFLTGQGDFSDNHFAQVSRHQLSLNGSVALPVPDALGELKVRGDFYYQSRIYYSDTAQGAGFGPLNSQSQKGYNIVNVGLDWNRFLGSHVDLNFFVNNLTKTRYRPFGLVLYNSIGYNSATLGDPRVFGLQGTLRF